MQAIHFMTRFFIPHEISLMNIEMQYWNLQTYLNIVLLLVHIEQYFFFHDLWW